MLFFYGIKIVSCLAILILTQLAYGERCRFLSRDKVECEDCKAPYLVNCGGKVGYVSRTAQATLKDDGRPYYQYDYTYHAMSVNEAFSRLCDTEESRQFLYSIHNGVPLYKTPLGKTVMAVVGEDKKEQGDRQQCRYILPSMPNIVQTRLSGELEWNVCYGHVVCDVDLEGLALVEAQMELFPVACTETLDGECPTARECMEDTAVEFSQVASETEQGESQFLRNQQLEQMVMTAIRTATDDFTGESWDKIQKRIDEEIQIQTARQRAVEVWMVDQQKERERVRDILKRSQRKTGRAARRGDQ